MKEAYNKPCGQRALRHAKPPTYPFIHISSMIRIKGDESHVQVEEASKNAHEGAYEVHQILVSDESLFLLT